MRTRRTYIYTPSFALVASLVGSLSLLHCSSGSEAAAPGNTAAFIGSWACHLDSTGTYSQPAGTPPRKEERESSETFTQIGTNELTDGGDCPGNFRVSGNTATLVSGANCTTDSVEISSSAGTFTVSGDSLTGSISATVNGTSDNGTKIVATLAIKYSCVRQEAADSGAGAGGASGGDEDAATGVAGGAANGGAGSGGAPNSGGPSCGSYMGGSQLGTCMPTGSAPTLHALYWSRDSCGADTVCVATLKAENPTAKFSACGNVSEPGACWPAYVLEGVVVGTGDLYPQGSCRPGEECMPCSNTVVPSLSFCDD